MNNSNKISIKKFEGSFHPVQVVRTAPMVSEKQKNFVELLPRPLLPQISIMWAFLESYLKKTADVFRIFPETFTIIEQNVADLKESFKLQAEGKSVDAELVGAHHILVNYLVRCSMVEKALTQERKEELLFILQKVGAQLADAYGTTPAVIAVDKIDRYVVDLMFMLAESVNKAISDMSDKSWMECNMTLVSVLNVYRHQLSKLLEGFLIFINAGELGGATTPSFHAHAMSRRKVEGVAYLPEETRVDDTILTKKHFERLGPRVLNGRYICENLEEIAIENFLLISNMLAERQFGVVIEDEEEFKMKVDGNTLIMSNPEEEEKFKHFLKRIKRISSQIRGNTYYAFNNFLKEIGQGEGEEIIRLLERYNMCFEDKAPAKALSPRQRAKEFCIYMKNIKAKRRYWKMYSEKVVTSTISEIFASSLIRKLKEQGVEKRIDFAINELVPEGLKIEFKLIDYFAFTGEDQSIPAFTFNTTPLVWSIYGRPVMKIAEESLNEHWEKIYYITEAFLRSFDDKKAEDDMLQKLDELFGISNILHEMSRAVVNFNSFSNSIMYAIGERENTNITEITKNCLRYFAKCFAFARKKKILHLPGLCPRATIIKVEEKEGSLIQTIEVTPIIVYTPIMALKQFEKYFGPIDLIRETNARFEVIGEGEKAIVVQKTGGECRTKGKQVFHRDKREILLSYTRVDDEPLVEAISETIKKYVFTRKNIGTPKVLYLQHYMREYISREYRDYPDLSWKKVAEILLYAEDEIYNINKNVNVDRILQHAFAKSPHSGMEIGKASQLIKIIKEARNDAIKRMNLVEQRSSKLKKQIEEGRFMSTNEILMKAVEKCNSDEIFLSSLDSLSLPRDEKIQEHILYIFGVRQIERKEKLKGENGRNAHEDLIRDNLDTISFFKLAELIVIEAFKNVRGIRLQTHANDPDDLESHLKDIDNSQYLLVQFIARSIYKFVSESLKLREGYQEVIRYYYEDHPFFKDLHKRIASELQHKSFQTEEIWKARGANPAEGYVDLIEKCILPAEKVSQCIVDCDIHGNAMDKIINIIGNNLNL